MPSVLFQRSSEVPVVRKGHPLPGAEAMPTTKSKKKPDLKARASELQGKFRAINEENRQKLQKQEALEAEDRATTERIKEQFVTPLTPGVLNEDLITNEKLPLEKRRRIAEDNSEALTESYLTLQKKEQAALASKDPEVLRDVREDLVFAQTVLKKALLNESFLETEDPKAAQTGYQRLKAEEAFLQGDTEALRVKKELDQLRKKQETDAILPDMIRALPKKDQDLATRWFHAENDRQKTDAYVTRLETWHHKKSALDLARTEAITHCKTCKIPAAIREAITSEKLTKAERQINLNRVTGDQSLKEFDQPRNWKESFIGIGLSLARTLGIKTQRTFANGELETHMQKVDTLRKDFEAIADTKGKFVGRQSPYQRRLTDEDLGRLDRISPGYTAAQRVGVIGQSEFIRKDAGQTEGLAQIASISEELTRTVATLQTMKEQMSQAVIQSAHASLRKLNKDLHTLSKTALVDSGEYYLAKQELNTAQQLLVDAQEGLEARQAKVEQNNATILRERAAKIAEITKRATDLSKLINDTQDRMTAQNAQSSAQNIKTLTSQLVQSGALKTSKDYITAEKALQSAEASLRAAEVVLASKREAQNLRAQELKEIINEKLKRDPKQEAQKDFIAEQYILAREENKDELIKLEHGLRRLDPSKDPHSVVVDTYLQMIHQLNEPSATEAEINTARLVLDKINTVLGVYKKLGVKNWVEFIGKMHTPKKTKKEPSITL